MESHLLQMRGLKLIESLLVLNFFVASFTDAWIETWVKSTLIPSPSSSHLLQMRGLKLLELVDAKSAPCRIFYRCVD